MDFFRSSLKKRGGKVTATDIKSPEWLDVNQLGIELKPRWGGHADPFAVARKKLGAKVNKRHINLYKMTPKQIGRFDLVFCNDLLLHLTDPLRALVVLRNVSRNLVVVGTPIMEEASGWRTKAAEKIRGSEKRSVAQFVGADGGGAFWLPTMTCLENMVKAAGLKIIKTQLIELDPKDAEYARRRGVIHAEI